MIFPSFGLGGIMPIMIAMMGVLMIVLRAGASRVYFDVVGTFQAARMLKDAQAMSTTMNSLMLDAFSGIEEAAMVLGEPLTQMIDQLVPIAREVEEAKIEFSKFVQEGEDVESVTANVIELGHGLGFAADQSLQAAARMAQLGGILGAGMVETGTEVGIKFGLISGMETEAAMQRMINLQQQTDFMTEGLKDNMTQEERAQTIRANSMSVLDQLNTVENRSAATMEQVTFVMNQFAAQAHLTGESIAYMAAMSATLIEAGEEQGKGGRALRMIYARLGANTSGAADALEALGVAVKDAEGNLRPLSHILKDLDAAMVGKTAADKQDIAQVVAGNRHYIRLIKLMENYDRVTQLAAEAVISMSPAQDEVNRRLETQIVSLQIAEARLHDYRAAVGEALLPALTAAAERQGDFTKAMGGFITASPKLAGGLVLLTKQFQNTIGPMFQMTLSIMQLNVASQTYALLQRTMAGEDIVRADFMKRMGSEQQFMTQGLMEYNAQNRAYAEGLQIVNMFEQQQITNRTKLTELKKLEMLDALALAPVEEAAIEKSIQNLEKKIMTEEKSIAQNTIKLNQGKSNITRAQAEAAVTNLSANATARKGQITRQLNVMKRESVLATQEEIKSSHASITVTEKEIEQARENIQNRRIEIQQMRERLALDYGDEISEQIMQEVEANRIATAEREATMAQMQARTKLSAQFSAATMLASGALTVFGKGEKSARAAIILSTMSMIPYLIQMMASITATTTDGAAKGFAATMATALGVQNVFAAGTYAALAASARTASAAVAAFGVAAIVMVGVGLVIGEVAEKLGFFNAGFNEVEQNLASSVIMDATKIIELFGTEMDSLTDSYDKQTESINNYNDAIKEAENRGDNTSQLKTERDAVVKLNQETEEAIRLKKAETIINKIDAETKDKLLNTTLKEQEEIQDNLLAQQISMGRAAMYMNGEPSEALRERRMETGALSAENKLLLDIFQELADAGIESGAAMDLTIRKLDEIAGYGADTAVTQMTSDLIEANDKLTEFNDNREELFYGFSSANLTGDLVKQVVNKGVETLITNTEVIMTNNFNGMTTDEVADQILLLIQRRAGSTNNILFSSN
tara:strand:- start:4087 stop:7377 length:3291 start_codon:yes stop_codon:yes gene_type:complete